MPTVGERPGDVVETDTVVVGGGQAGLATAYHLGHRGISHVVLDAGEQVGDSWRERWDSLRLFTPAGFSHLPGLQLPGPATALPEKDYVAAYLESYVRRFGIRVEAGVRVERVRPDGGHWLVSARSGGGSSPAAQGGREAPAGARTWRARRVVVATGAHAVPRIPDFAGDVAVPAVHSAGYRRPDQLPDGPVLVVGAGNSGAEIAVELSRSRPVWLAGRDVGHAPRLGNTGYRVLRALGRPGAALAARLPERGADPLGRLRAADLAAAGVRRLPRVSGVAGGLPVAGDPVAAASVVWCTGFGPALEFLDGPVRHRHGVTDRPGLYLVGVPLQTSPTSHLLGGVGRDAAHVVAHLARHS